MRRPLPKDQRDHQYDRQHPETDDAHGIGGLTVKQPLQSVAHGQVLAQPWHRVAVEGNAPDHREEKLAVELILAQEK